MNEADIQAPKERKIIKPNKYLVTICNRKKRRAEEKLTLIKKRVVRGSPLHKAVLKVKEAKKRMNNVVTIERNKLLKSKFDSCKGDLKATFKKVNQLLNKANCSKFLSHTNEKTQANYF